MVDNIISIFKSTPSEAVEVEEDEVEETEDEKESRNIGYHNEILDMVDDYYEEGGIIITVEGGLVGISSSVGGYENLKNILLGVLVQVLEGHVVEEEQDEQED